MPRNVRVDDRSFAPALCGYWMDRTGWNWLPAALLTVATCLASAAAAVTARETHRTPLREPGRPRC
ncbi:hypothetical protein [Actinophytocola sp.]|uniref:hypothetical protein n=1 Tax=Actinophytocola sp. TaxID=1872138 RepID=UPI002ED0B89F